MKDKKIWLVILLSGIIASLITIPNIVVGKGIYTLTADFNVQQIPFITSISRSIRLGAFSWSWLNDIGADFIGSFSFYNLFSPFNVFMYFFKPEFIIYLIGPVFIIKYIIASLTSYLFLKRYVKNKNYAVIGSILYSFSGFQFTNTLFYHFHDVVALFPLMLYSLDNLLYENKKSFFAITIFINAVTNWFFFIGEIIFLLIYYLIKLACKEIKFDKKKIFNILFEGIFGICLAAFVLIPSYFFMKSNPRLSTSWTLNSMLKFNGTQYFEILKAFVTPSQIMSYKAIMLENNYGSVETYLPLIGIIFAVPYIIKNRKQWDSKLTIILAIITLVPILNNIFILFQTTYYTRWLYMFTLILVLISVKAMDQELKINSGVIASLISFILLASYVAYCYFKLNDIKIYDIKYLLVIIIFVFFNIIITIIIYDKSYIKKRIPLFLIFISIFIVFWGNYSINKYKKYAFKVIDIANNQYKMYDDINDYKEYRTTSSNSCGYNYGYLGHINNLKSWNSTASSSSFTFLKSIGIDRGITMVIDPENKELTNFLGIKYVFSCSDAEELEQLGYKLFKKYKMFSVFENTNQVYLADEINDFILQDEFEKEDLDHKVKILNNKIVLSDNQIKKYKDLIKTSGKLFESNFKFENNGFSVNINSDHDSFVVIKVPYEKYWKATNNGKQINFENVDNGLIGIKVNKGNNKIVFKYENYITTLSFIVSIASLCLYVTIKIIYKNKL